MRMLRMALALVPVLVSWACGGASPTAPSVPPAPSETPAPAPSPTPTPQPTAPPGPTVLRSASFESANGYTTRGGASILRDGTSHRLELDDKFQTSSSGGLDVRLCRQTLCGDGDLNLGPIQKYNGAQSYPLRDDGGAYNYVVIWCRGVNLPFGYGRLR